jgi:hypothetical protein
MLLAGENEAHLKRVAEERDDKKRRIPGLGEGREEGGHPCPMALLGGCGREQGFQEVYGGYEVLGLDRHGQVDRIEVGFATKAASKVRLRIDHGKELAAAGTEQAGATVPLLVGPFQDRQQGVQRYLVAKTVEELASEVLGHQGLLVATQGSWNSFNV